MNLRVTRVGEEHDANQDADQKDIAEKITFYKKMLLTEKSLLQKLDENAFLKE